MLSESYISATSSSGTAYGAVTPDNYLISPQVRLGGSISFYAGARNTDYCAEKFSVMVSTTDNTNTASFTTVGTWILSLSAAGYTSEPYTVDLSAYSGMGYVAIRHWDCNDQWILCIDDVTIVEGEDSSTDGGNFNYGETCVVTATPQGDYHFENWTENGTAVSSDASYSFTVTGDRDLVANFTQTTPCYAPTALAASDVDHQSAVLNWNGEADSWKVAYKLSTASQFTEVAVNTNSYAMTELLPETAYTVMVAAICEDQTVWSDEISFTTLPLPCPAPTDVMITDINRHSAVVSWIEAGDATSWVVAYRSSNAGNDLFTEVEVFEPTYTLSNLAEGTLYDVKVRPVCDGIMDSWSDTEFTTESCYTISLNANDPVWMETFEGYTQSTVAATGEEPDCWVLIPDGVDLDITTQPQLYGNFNTSENGGYTLRMKNRCIYATPLMDNVDVAALTMTFNLRQPKTVYRLQVGVINPEGEFELVKEINNSGTEMEQVEVDFSSFTGNGNRIAFRNTLRNGTNLDYSINYIDDIQLSYNSLSCGIGVPYAETFDTITSLTTTGGSP